MTGSKNIVLVGMPGSGKSTAGLLLARSICYDFIDTDILIQNRERITLQQIINQYGMEEFLKIEAEILLSVKSTIRTTVIATGGSAVLTEKSMVHLKQIGHIVWLDVPAKILRKRLINIHSRGIAMSADQSIDDLLASRLPYYRKYADTVLSIDDLDIEATVELLIDRLGLAKCGS